MQAFTATVKTPVGDYTIDYKANKHSHNWAVMHSTGATYLSSVQEALDWIESHATYLIDQSI